LRQKIQEEYDKKIDEHFNELKKVEAEEDRLKLKEKLKLAKVVDDYNQGLREKRKIEKALLKQVYYFNNFFFFFFFFFYKK